MSDRYIVTVVCDSFGDTPQWVVDDLAAQNIECRVDHVTDPQLIADRHADADCIWLCGGGVLMTPDTIAQLTNCTAILRSGSGTDNVPVEAATEAGIVVINTPKATAGPVADATVAMLMAAYRRIPAQDKLMRQGGWGQFMHEHWPNAPLEGQTLGLVAFGRIAQGVAKRMAGFDMRIVAADPFANPQTAADLGVELVELDTLFAESDIVSLHCPLIDSTHHLVNADRLKQMKSTAILVNMARGPVVQEAALVEALKSGTIAAAALDVFEVEPTTADNPLCQLDNVVIAPHCSAHTNRIAEDFRKASIESLIDLANGRWPESCVNQHKVQPRRELAARV